MNKQYDTFSDVLKAILNLDSEFSKSKIEVLNRSFTYPLNNEKNVVISLWSAGVHNHYHGIYVTIVWKENGNTINKVFPFKQFFEATHIWSFSSKYVEWYGNPPNDQKVENMLNSIKKYVELWK